MHETCATGCDVIGDLHGCHSELVDLLLLLGYQIEQVENGSLAAAAHPEDRLLIFVGDFTDRGPQPLAALRTVHALVEGGHCAILGNHDDILLKFFHEEMDLERGYDGFDVTQRAVRAISRAEHEVLCAFLEGLPHHMVVRVPGNADLIAAHAGIPRAYIGQDAPEVRSRCVYGHTASGRRMLLASATAELRRDYADPAGPVCVFGHWVVDEPRVEHRTVAIDTGCAFGGSLTAFRYPEWRFVSVPAKGR